MCSLLISSSYRLYMLQLEPQTVNVLFPFFPELLLFIYFFTDFDFRIDIRIFISQVSLSLE